jgi:hypothetical protein
VGRCFYNISFYEEQAMEIKKKHIFGTMILSSRFYVCGGGSDKAID